MSIQASCSDFGGRNAYRIDQAERLPSNRVCEKHSCGLGR